MDAGRDTKSANWLSEGFIADMIPAHTHVLHVALAVKLNLVKLDKQAGKP